MIDGRDLVVDTLSPVHRLLKPWITHEFWDLSQHTVVKDSIYVIGRQQFVGNLQKIKQLIADPDIVVVFDNSAEGSSTLIDQLRMMELDQAALSHQLLIISGGELPGTYQHVLYEHLLTCVLDYDENQLAMQDTDKIFAKHLKPYKFLFLNGRARPHRKYMYEQFRQLDLLKSSLWSMLDNRVMSRNQPFKLMHNGTDLMTRPAAVRCLPQEYEFSAYQHTHTVTATEHTKFVKHDLFNNEWGEIYLNPAPYIDTYFSVVTETVLDHSCSFRTEKIAKPLAMAHPWIAATNTGFYRSIRNLGFRTFETLIDESFDQIDNDQDRIDRVIATVHDLCQQDLPSFLSACRDTCKYNQQHLQELTPRMRAAFPDAFFDLVAHNE